MQLILDWVRDIFLSSEFFATVLGLAVGSYWISKVHARRAAEEETLRWLIEKIEDYAELARRYWSMLVDPDEMKCSELSSRLKVEIKFFYPTLDHLHMIKTKNRNEIKGRMRELYHEATSIEYVKGVEIPDSRIYAAHISISNASAELRKSIYGALTM